MFGSIGMTEMILILGILLLLFGGKKLPELAKGMGESIRAFKKGMVESQQLEDKGQPVVASETKQIEANS